MNTFLWLVQCLLALIFVASGAAKSVMSKERMAAAGQTGVAPYSLPFIRFIAVCEIAGAFGLTLPLALGVCRQLASLAACGLGVIMIGAAVTHWRLKEPRNVGINFLLFILCLFVAWRRL